MEDLPLDLDLSHEGLLLVIICGLLVIRGCGVVLRDSVSPVMKHLGAGRQAGGQAGGPAGGRAGLRAGKDKENTKKCMQHTLAIHTPYDDDNGNCFELLLFFPPLSTDLHKKS